MLIFWTSALLWLSFDLITKGWAAGNSFVPYVFSDRFFNFTLQKNTGVAFSIELPRTIQVIGSTLILLTLVYIAQKSHSRQSTSSTIALGIVFGGGLGNLINRIHGGYVVDFIYLYPFPVFNIADLGITIGLIVLVVYNYSKKTAIDSD